MSLKDFHLVFISIVTLLLIGLTIYSVVNNYSLIATILLGVSAIAILYYGLKFRSKIKKLESKF